MRDILRTAAILVAIMIWWGTIQWAHESGRRQGVAETHNEIVEAEIKAQTDRTWKHIGDMLRP